MSQKTITYLTDKFVIKSFYDVDTSTEGIDVLVKGGKHIGEMWGETIPDKFENEFYKEEMEGLTERVGKWLDDNYYNNN